MNRRKLLAASLMLTLSACSTTNTSLPEPPAYPSDAWLETNVPLYVEAAEQRPTTTNRAYAEELVALAQRRERANAKMAQVDRELTLSWGNRGRAGAAMLQPAYIHVLGESHNDRYEFDTGRLTSSAPSTTETTRPSNDSGERNWITAGASMYELQRWERYCDQGRGMDEPDWRFVTSQGDNNIPDMLIVNCSPPSHDMADYLNAWSRFCEAETTTAEQRSIVRNSSRPRTIVNPCKALN
tara:strand:+ start:1569 stop:2288 length:720 start_codon:yes stop_codon:yes gene_type:complete